MKASLKSSIVACAVSAALAAPAVQATNGYFLIGIGAKNRSMGGAGIAYGQDGLAAATNPASMSMLETNRIDAGVELFNPRRSGGINATCTRITPTCDPTGAGAGTTSGANSAEKDSGATMFGVPNLGGAMKMGNMTVGLTMSGAGGMNTRHNTNHYTNSFAPAITAFVGALSNPAVNPLAPYAAEAAAIQGVAGALGGDPDVTTQTLGVNLAQMIIAPSVSMEVADGHHLGGSLLIGYQQFRAYGLGLFKGFSSNPSFVTNKGDDKAFGAGIKVGWTGEITDSLTLGAVATSKIYMQEFDKYKGLFAEQGDFDIPAHFGLGLSYRVNDKTNIAMDVTRILYGDVASIANKGPTAQQYLDGFMAVLLSQTGDGGALLGSPAVSNPLGTNNGWGFGWDDITVVKIGIDHQYNKQWSFRAGLNIGENPIDDKENLFNLIAPGVVEKHITLGATYALDDYSELSFGYMRALREDQSYSYSTSHLTALGFPVQAYDVEIGMDQHALEISYGMKF